MRTLILIFLLVSTSLIGQNSVKTLSDTVFNVGDRVRISEPQYSTICWGLPESQGVDSLKPLADFITKHKNMTFEIQSHTDSRGVPSKNLTLSQARSDDIKNKLIKYYQINPDQIIAKGYGNTKLLIADTVIKKAKTKEEKEALHQKNRRTVLLITKIQ